MIYRGVSVARQVLEFGSVQSVLDSLSLRQARVLREMLRLGSFTVSEVVSAAGEDERYVQNLLCDGDGALNKLAAFSPVRNVKQRGPGAPPKVWAVNPERQDEILGLLGPHYQTFEVERRVNQAQPEPADFEEFVYRFVRPNSRSEGASGRPVETTISIQKTGESVEFCAPQIQPKSDDRDEQDTIPWESSSIVDGLTAICQIRPDSSEGVTAVVNYRDGEMHFVFLRRGSPALFSIGQLPENRGLDMSSKATGLSIESRHLFLSQLQAASQLYRASSANEEIDKILITGNLRAPLEICNLVSTVMKVDCEFLDPFDSFAFSSKSIKQRQSRNAIMNCVPEIGYAFKKWQFARQNESVGPKAQQQFSRSSSVAPKAH
jgi:hypothetical protein